MVHKQLLADLRAQDIIDTKESEREAKLSEKRKDYTQKIEQHNSQVEKDKLALKLKIKEKHDQANLRHIEMLELIRKKASQGKIFLNHFLFRNYNLKR